VSAVLTLCNATGWNSSIAATALKRQPVEIIHRIREISTHESFSGITSAAHKTDHPLSGSNFTILTVRCRDNRLQRGLIKLTALLQAADLQFMGMGDS
jgi:hypothetical protein